jgi:adenylylsulfate kinase-like enzyme
VADEHFLGRRREQQQLLPALRGGDLQAVVLTGLGGAGKSTLATRLARKLEADGWRRMAGGRWRCRAVPRHC